MNDNILLSSLLPTIFAIVIPAVFEGLRIWVWGRPEKITTPVSAPSSALLKVPPDILLAVRRKQLEQRLARCLNILGLAYMIAMFGCLLTSELVGSENTLWILIGGGMFMGLVLLGAIVGAIKAVLWTVKTARGLYYGWIKESPYYSERPPTWLHKVFDVTLTTNR